MKTISLQKVSFLCVLAGIALVANHTQAESMIVKPARGGGLDTNAPMIHVDIFYDYAANQMHATLDTSQGTPKLVPLPPGCLFDTRSNYAVLNGKAYNFQYAWNPGGTFTPPAGAEVWIECVNRSPELECYDGPGNRMLPVPRTYAPIFGTADSSAKWQWYRAMAHNSYAVLNPTNPMITAQYHVYFGDAQTGSRDAYAQYNDATVTLTWQVDPVIVAKPARGGALDANAPMIHVDLFYDYTNNQMQATLDTSKGVPKLAPLPAGYIFDSRSNYAVLNGKAYNFQYAWNPGGIFSPPPGAEVWIECINRSPGLECYDGPGNKMLMTPRTYAPIFGTDGSSAKWQWYRAMAHNSYAIVNPTNRCVTADYRVYFGDAVTGSRDAYAQYTDATVTLTWNVDLPGPPEFHFGAVEVTNGAPLRWLNSQEICTNSLTVVNFDFTNSGPCAQHYACGLPLLAMPATPANGGPAANHAALGSRIEVQFLSLSGPENGGLSVWEPGDTQPRFGLRVAEEAPTNGVTVSAGGAPDDDPYGQSQSHLGLTKPGLYCLEFRLVDTSTNGPDGGPIHSPSPVYRVFLQAGLTLSGLLRQGTSATVLFGGGAGKSFYLESCPSLDPAPVWQTVAGPLTGTGRLQTLTDPAPNNARLFYRVRSTSP